MDIPLCFADGHFWGGLPFASGMDQVPVGCFHQWPCFTRCIAMIDSRPSHDFFLPSLYGDRRACFSI